MRIGALANQRLSLAHAKAMLFIHDHQTERPKSAAVFDQCVRADHHIQQPLLYAKPRLPLLAEALAAGDSRHADSERGQRCHEPSFMLLRQDVGRRHECDLVARPHRHQTRRRRHCRLARPDLTLQQAPHRNRPTHVRFDLADHAPLRPGQRVRQAPFEVRQRPIRHVERRGGPLGLALIPPLQHPRLNPQ